MSAIMQDLDAKGEELVEVRLKVRRNVALALASLAIRDRKDQSQLTEELLLANPVVDRELSAVEAEPTEPVFAISKEVIEDQEKKSQSSS